MENLPFIEAPVVTEWKRQSREKGIKKGILMGKIEVLMLILGKRGASPDELSNRINACSDNAQLDQWMDIAFDTTFVEFRARAKI